MKIKKLIELKEKLEGGTSDINVAEEGMEPINVRFDVYEELLFISYRDKEVALSEKEVKNLRNLLNRML